jgi:hypothetical protein
VKLSQNEKHPAFWYFKSVHPWTDHFVASLKHQLK